MAETLVPPTPARPRRPGPPGRPGRPGRASPGRPAVGVALLAAAGLAPIGLSPGLAAAAPPRVLALPYQHLQPDLPTDLGEQTTQVIVREVGRGGVVVVRGDVGSTLDSNRSAPASGRSARQRRAGARAEGLIAGAKASIEAGRMAAAIEDLERAVELIETNADAVPDLRVLPEAYLQLAIARFRDGREDDADDALTGAIHLDPDRELEPSRYPPIFIKVYDRARASVLRRPRGKIGVRATPGARVLLDGRALGTAPLLLDGVLPGRHWIAVEASGGSMQVEAVAVPANETTSVVIGAGDAEGRPAPEGGVLAALAANHLSADQLAEVRAAGRRAQADFVMLGAIFGTDTAYEVRTGLLDVATGEVGRLTDVAFDLDLLSAEIEVFKLAEDARRQIEGGEPTKPATTGSAGWSPAADFERGPAPLATRMTMARAAPDPIGPPRSLYAKAPSAPAPRATATAGGPLAPKSTVIPKDELAEVEAHRSAAIVEEQPRAAGDGDGDGSELWWVWVVVGVAAAGAAAAATTVALTEPSPDQGTLRVRW